MNENRSAFENSASMKGRLFKRRSDNPDVYWDNDVELAWSIWKEAINSVSNVAIEENHVKKIVYEYTKLNPNQKDDQDLLSGIYSAFKTLLDERCEAAINLGFRHGFKNGYQQAQCDVEES